MTELNADWENKMDLWRRVLNRKPTDLNHKQLIALASQYGRDLVSKHEDDPFDVPHLKSKEEVEAKQSHISPESIHGALMLSLGNLWRQRLQANV